MVFVWLRFYYQSAVWRDYGFNASRGGKMNLRSIHPAGWVTVRCTYLPCRSNTWQKSLLRVKPVLHTLYSSPCVCMWVWNSCDETSSGPEWQSRQNAYSFHPRPLIAFIPCTNCKKHPSKSQLFAFRPVLMTFISLFVKLQLLLTWIGSPVAITTSQYSRASAGLVGGRSTSQTGHHFNLDAIFYSYLYLAPNVW